MEYVPGTQSTRISHCNGKEDSVPLTKLCTQIHTCLTRYEETARSANSEANSKHKLKHKLNPYVGVILKQQPQPPALAEVYWQEW